jgi:DUF917 family protein
MSVYPARNRTSINTDHITRITDAMTAVMEHMDLKTFDACIPNEVGGLNAFEALLAAHRFGKSGLDTDLVARAYPMVYQTIRALNDIPVTPSAMSNGHGISKARSLTLTITFEGWLMRSRSSLPQIITKPKRKCVTCP